LIVSIYYYTYVDDKHAAVGLTMKTIMNILNQLFKVKF